MINLPQFEMHHLQTFQSQTLYTNKGITKDNTASVAVANKLWYCCMNTSHIQVYKNENSSNVQIIHNVVTNLYVLLLDFLF